MNALTESTSLRTSDLININFCLRIAADPAWRFITRREPKPPKAVTSNSQRSHPELPRIEDHETIRVADVYTLKEHRSEYPVLLAIGNVLRPVRRGHEGNFPNNAAAKPHVLRRQNSECPVCLTHFCSLNLGSLEQRLFQLPVSGFEQREESWADRRWFKARTKSSSFASRA